MSIRTEYSKSGNIKYEIDEEKRTVIAVLECSSDDANIVFQSACIKYGKGVGFGSMVPAYRTKYQIKSEYVGKSKCHPDDVFDVEFGKRLALLRAKDKYLRAMNDRLEDMIVWVGGLYANIEKMGMKHYRLLVENGSEIYAVEKETGLYE